MLKLLSKKADTEDLNMHRNRQRFGVYPKHYQTNGLLIHCVSMGEVNAAQTVINNLKQSFPEIPITLTTTSVTGAAQAIRLFGESVQHAFLPIDFPLFNHWVLSRLKPRAFIVTEVEIWPNLIHQCYKKGIANVLINARMTSRSLANYQKLAFLFRPTLRKFNAICAQGPQDFDNFIAMGVYKNQLHLTNNLKFDLDANQNDAAKGETLNKRFKLLERCVLVAASTHDSEEKSLLSVFKKLRESNPSLCLIIVPRYPHRFEEVSLLVKAMGFESCNFSQQESAKDSEAEVIVVDTMGYLKAAYSIANLSFVGGSLVDKGGHNPLESALYKVPICMGHSTYNNPASVSALVRQKALHIVNDETQLFERLKVWTEHPEQAREAGINAYKVISENTGASSKTLNIIKSCL